MDIAGVPRQPRRFGKPAGAIGGKSRDMAVQAVDMQDFQGMGLSTSRRVFMVGQRLVGIILVDCALIPDPE
jgi:hypothetical protein